MPFYNEVQRKSVFELKMSELELNAFCQRNCQPKIKKPIIIKTTGFFVESGRVELPSKQATKELSTRLFPV